MQQTRSDTIDTTGKSIFTFDPSLLENLLITANAPIYIGYGDLGQAVFPLLANQAWVILWSDFSAKVRSKHGNMIEIFAKSQAAASVTVYFAYLGRNQ